MEPEFAERSRDTPPRLFESLKASPYARSGLAMLVAAALGAVWKVGLIGAEPVSLTVGRLGILVVFALLVFDFVRTTQRRRPSTRAVVLIGGLGALGVWIGVSAATFGCACATEVAGYAELFAMVTLAVALGTLEPRLRVPLLVASAVGAVSAAVLALAGVSGLTPGTINTSAYQGRLAGPYGNANYLGYAVALALPALLGIVFAAGRAVRLVALVAFGVAAFTLVQTFSRSGIAAAAAGLLVVLAMIPRRKRYGFALAAVVAGALAALALLAYPAFREERRVATSPATSAYLAGTDRSGWEASQQGLVPRGLSEPRNDPTGQAIIVSSDQAYEGLSRRWGSAEQGVAYGLRFEARSLTPGLRLAFGLEDAKLGNGPAVAVQGVGERWRDLSLTWRPTARSRDARVYLWQVSGPSTFQIRNVTVGAASGQPAPTRLPARLLGPASTSTELAAKERRDIDARVVGLRLGFRAIVENPLTGLGWGDFPRYADARSPYGPVPTHNEYLRFGAELGLLGLLLLLVAAGAVLTGLRDVRSDPMGRALVGAVVTGGVGLAFIYGLVAAAASLPLAMAAAALVTSDSGEEPGAPSSLALPQHARTRFRKWIERPSRKRSGSRPSDARGRPDVIHVLPEAALGGAERTVLDLLSSPTLTDLDQRVLFVSRKPNAVFPPESVVPPVGPPALGPVAAVLALVRARPRVAHGWLLRGNLTACLAKLLRRDLLVITSERNLGHTLTRSKRLAERLVALIENLATANSSAVRGAAVQRIPRRAGRFRVIAPGVTALRQDSVESTSGVMVGRLHLVKDHETALRAWTRVVRERTDATLAILGDGPERERLERRIAALGLDSSVRLLGDRSPWPYLYGSRLFLSTSRAEGFSRAMLEALSTGLPIVTTATGGSRELPDEATWLAAVGDDGKLAEHILALLGDEPARAQAGRAALRGARELFSVTRCHEHYRALYASVGIG